MSTYMVRVGGRSGVEIGQHSPPVYETLADGGCGIASWTWDVGLRGIPSVIDRGARAHIYMGGDRLWTGRVESIDRDSGGVRCRGLWADGDGIPMLDGSGNTTRDGAVAIATAKAAPWSWDVSGSIAGTVAGDSLEPRMITEGLRLVAQQSGLRAGVDGRGWLYARADPTEPRWIINATDAALSGSSLGEVNVYLGRYWDGTQYRSVTSPTPATPASAAIVDLTAKYPTLTTVEAQALVNQIAVLRTDRPTWAGGITVQQSQVTTIGGAPACLESIKGGDMARLTGLSDAAQNAIGGRYLDVVLGRVVNTSGSRAVYLEPVGVQPTSLEDALALAAAS